VTAQEVRKWKVPQPVEGDPRRIVLRYQTATGSELDAKGMVQRLDAQTLQQRWRQLELMSGSSRP
jgi:hypothetical protein